MKRQILNLEGIVVLTKQQQKAVNGGSGTCCARQFRKVDMSPYESNSYTASVHCGISKNDAISWASGGDMSGNWCCDSCGSASWL